MQILGARPRPSVSRNKKKIRYSFIRQAVTHDSLYVETWVANSFNRDKTYERTGTRTDG